MSTSGRPVAGHALSGREGLMRDHAREETAEDAEPQGGSGSPPWGACPALQEAGSCSPEAFLAQLCLALGPTQGCSD